MKRILFVCHGNICRSVMAEYMFKNKINELGLNEKYYCESRAVSLEEIGNDIYYLAKDCLNKHHIPYTRHYAKQITQEDYDEFDEIYVMDEYNLRRINNLLQDPQNKIKMLIDRQIPDPWYTGYFDETYDAILEGIDKILEEQL